MTPEELKIAADKAAIKPEQQFDSAGNPFFETSDPLTNTTTQSPGVSPFSSAPNISQGTDSLWDAYNQNKTNVASAISGADATGGSSSSILSRLEAERKNINEFSLDDEKGIREAGEAAGSAYDPLIDEAEERRRVTLPSEIVRAGERGGFMSTQFAGEAALLPTEGREGESFVGVGGRLDQARQTLDRNVSFLRAKKEEAIGAARSAARKAIKTGKREDFRDATDLAKLAQSFQMDAENMLIKKQNLMLNIAGEERAQTTAAFNIISEIKAGDTVTIGNKTYTGIANEDVDQFFTGTNIMSAMKDIPYGEWKEIYNPMTGESIPIMGLASDDPSIEKNFSLNDDGEGIITTYKVGPNGELELKDQVNIGKVGKTKTAATNIALNFPTISEVVDPETGKPKWVKKVDRATGKITYENIETGEPVPASEVQADEVTEVDPFDAYINSIIREFLAEEEDK